MAERTWTIERIARAVGATVEGDGAAEVRGVAGIESARPGDLTFAVDARRAARLDDCRATAVVLPPKVALPAGLTALRVADPEAAIAAVLGLMAEPEDLPAPGVHPTAVVDASARLGMAVAIGPCAVVGPDVVLEDGVVLSAHVCLAAGVVVGAGSVLMPGVVVRQRCRIGRRCRIHPNAVIGADGFGYYTRGGVHHKVPHIGTVEIGDDVEIGAGACVDRAKFGRTIVGDGSKIDNLVQVAHNVRLGRHVLLASLVGVAGSAVIGDRAVLGGHVGVRDNVSIGDGAQVAAYSAVAGDIPAGAAVGGIPTIPMRDFLRTIQLVPRLPELKKQLKELQARVDALESATDDDRR